MDSTGDDVSQLKNNWQNLAEAVVKAVSEYTNTFYDKGTGTTYIVKSGDTLWSIAKKYNITVNELKQLNNLTSNTLRIGQILKVNEQPIISDENIYIVKSGDTLYGIARKYNITLNDLIAYNNLNSTLLSIGQILNIPYENVSDEENNEYIIYTVKSGDNLYSIARKYNTTVNKIMDFNNLTSNLLSIGQTLKIPLNEQQNITYTVKSGDSLYSIARKYNTTVDGIKTKNNLTNNLLSIGQILVI